MEVALDHVNGTHCDSIPSVISNHREFVFVLCDKCSDLKPFFIIVTGNILQLRRFVVTTELRDDLLVFLQRFSLGKTDVESCDHLCDVVFILEGVTISLKSPRTDLRESILCLNFVNGADTTFPISTIEQSALLIACQDDLRRQTLGDAITAGSYSSLSEQTKESLENEKWAENATSSENGASMLPNGNMSKRLDSSSLPPFIIRDFAVNNLLKAERSRTWSSTMNCKNRDQILYHAPVSNDFRFISGATNEIINATETMAEAKLAMLAPAQYLRIVLRWHEQRLNRVLNIFYLDGYLEAVRQQHLQLMQRICSLLKKAVDDCDCRSGPPFFKRSSEKANSAFHFFPTNVHLQSISASTKSKQTHILDYFTSGAFSAISDGFPNGGLSRMRAKFHEDLVTRGLSQPEAESYQPEVMWTGFLELTEIEKRLAYVRGQVMRGTMEGDFSEEFFNRLVSEFWELIATLRNFGNSAHLEAAVDALVQCFDKFRLDKPNMDMTNGVVGNDLESSQYLKLEFEVASLDTLYSELEAQMACVITKVHNLKEIKETEETSQLKQWMPDLKRACLNVVVSLEKVHRTLLDAWFLRKFIVLGDASTYGISVKGNKDSPSTNNSWFFQFPSKTPTGPSVSALASFYRLEWRQTVVFCHAISTVIPMAVNHLWSRNDQPGVDGEATEKDGSTSSQSPFICLETLSGSRKLLMLISSYLSCAFDERGMLEDVSEGVRLIRDYCSLRLVKAFSTSQSVCPVFEGTPFQIIATVPLPEEVLEKLVGNVEFGLNASYSASMNLGGQKAVTMSLYPILFSVGINEDQTIASFVKSKLSLEFEVNRDGCKLLDQVIAQLVTTVTRFESEMNNNEIILGEDLESRLHRTVIQARKLMQRLSEQIALEQVKNVEILHLVSEIGQVLSVPQLIHCKSGKDRTSLAVTLEEIKMLQREFDLPDISVPKALDKLRSEGTRLSNVYKNAGLKAYAFTRFQVQFLPDLFKPPQGSYKAWQT